MKANLKTPESDKQIANVNLNIIKVSKTFLRFKSILHDLKHVSFNFLLDTCSLRGNNLFSRLRELLRVFLSYKYSKIYKSTIGVIEVHA